jgi:hypothetical protein
MFRLHGGEWVAREIVKHVQSLRAKFILKGTSKNSSRQVAANLTR